MAQVTTICYGQTEQWASRRKTAEHFLEGMMCSEGSERERYTKIYTEIMSGKSVCTDIYEEKLNCAAQALWYNYQIRGG